VDKDYLKLSAEEFRQLEGYQLKEALQLLTGYMAVAQEEMRENQRGHHLFLAAKEDFTSYKSVATTLQTLLRSA
jgi:hypothetical protein